jgi:hypothetical protein
LRKCTPGSSRSTTKTVKPARPGLDRLLPQPPHDLGVDVVGLVDLPLERRQLALDEPADERLKVHELARCREVHLVPVMEWHGRHGNCQE